MIFQFANRYIDANQKVPWRLRIHLCWIPNAWICTSPINQVMYNLSAISTNVYIYPQAGCAA